LEQIQQKAVTKPTLNDSESGANRRRAIRTPLTGQIKLYTDAGTVIPCDVWQVKNALVKWSALVAVRYVADIC